MESDQFLVCSTVDRIIALALADVRETMRPLPITTMSGAPAFVKGLAMIRGIATPVIATDALFDPDPTQPLRAAGNAPRFVTVAAGSRPLALLVGEVLGLRRLSPAIRADIPQLARSGTSRFLQEVGILDERMLFVLNASHLVPATTWDSIEHARGPA